MSLDPGRKGKNCPGDPQTAAVGTGQFEGVLGTKFTKAGQLLHPQC